MKIKKITRFFFTLFALTGATLFYVGCDDNNLEDAAEEVGDAAEDGADAAKDAIHDGADAVKDATN